jgi:UDP-N-acetylmuramyl pentapeptide phosphotransferase/UDP-N-acetylglucosamine-1-phosphate transferase
VSFRDRLGLSVSQAVVAWGLVVLIGGAAGLLAMLICNYLLSFGGEDSSGKHGISTVNATRLGGVAIVTYMLMHLGYQASVGLILPPLTEAAIVVTCLAYFFIGVYEDLSGLLSARVRFSLMLCLALITVRLAPDLVLSPVGIGWVDVIVGTSALGAIIFTALCIAFIPNAFNTADGANGLVAGTSALTFVMLISVAPHDLVPFLLAAVVGCLVFLVFNLISGRFFLGDGGAYFLGVLAGLSLVMVSNESDVSVWWLLSLVFYPVADLIWSMVRRLRKRVSPLNPDNQHFHNLLFAWLNVGDRSPMRANNYTGLVVVAVFSGAPFVLVMLQVLSVKDNEWFFVVLCQWVLYIIGSKYLNDRLCILPIAKVRNVTT